MDHPKALEPAAADEASPASSRNGALTKEESVGARQQRYNEKRQMEDPGLQLAQVRLRYYTRMEEKGVILNATQQQKKRRYKREVQKLMAIRDKKRSELQNTRSAEAQLKVVEAQRETAELQLKVESQRFDAVNAIGTKLIDGNLSIESSHAAMANNTIDINSKVALEAFSAYKSSLIPMPESRDAETTLNEPEETTRDISPPNTAAKPIQKLKPIPPPPPACPAPSCTSNPPEETGVASRMLPPPPRPTTTTNGGAPIGNLRKPRPPPGPPPPGPPPQKAVASCPKTVPPRPPPPPPTSVGKPASCLSGTKRRREQGEEEAAAHMDNVVCRWTGLQQKKKARRVVAVGDSILSGSTQGMPTSSDRKHVSFADSATALESEDKIRQRFVFKQWYKTSLKLRRVQLDLTKKEAELAAEKKESGVTKEKLSKSEENVLLLARDLRNLRVELANARQRQRQGI